MKIGILGGSFDPIHNAHLKMAEAAQQQLGLDRVIFIPANVPPHKKNSTLTDPDLRLRMVRMAVENNPFFQVSDLELKRKGASYTLDTLLELKKKFPDSTSFYLIMGSDSFLEFQTWHEWKKITMLCQLAVAPRKGFEIASFPKYATALKMEPIEISATQIRAAFADNQSIPDALPRSVREMIEEHRLYSKKA